MNILFIYLCVTAKMYINRPKSMLCYPKQCQYCMISVNCYLIINFLDQQAEVQRSGNRQSFSQRPAQQPPTNTKIMSTGSGPVSTQISSMFCPSHSQPLLHSHGGGGSSSGNSSNNRSISDLPGVCVCKLFTSLSICYTSISRP